MAKKKNKSHTFTVDTDDGMHVYKVYLNIETDVMQSCTQIEYSKKNKPDYFWFSVPYIVENPDMIRALIYAYDFGLSNGRVIGKNALREEIREMLRPEAEFE